MKRMVLGLVVVASLTGLASLAQEPTTRPEWRQPEDVPVQFRRLSMDERIQAEEFARQYMPNLHALAMESPRFRRGALWRYALVRSRNLQQAENNPSLRDRVLKNIEREDSMFQILQEYRRALPEQRPLIRQKLREKMAQIVDGYLNDRAERIERLKAKLQEEQEKLQQDLANREQIIDKRLERFLGELPPESEMANEMFAPSTPATQPAQ